MNKLFYTQDEIAKLIAHAAHRGQYRKDGITPYIFHPQAVANKFSDVSQEFYRATAWLHDVLEDCPKFNVEILELFGINSSIIEAVKLLTKSKDVLYDVYIHNICQNYLALCVKIADIEHNLSDNPKATTKIRYEQSLIELKKAKEKYICE
jgi:(p)ppGpp synthase/HD superfamily hydrolase